MTHWSDNYLGLPWRADSFNCGDLVLLVQREVFHREVRIEGAHPVSPTARNAAIGQALAAVSPTANPADGDGVLIRNGSMRHVGVYCALPEPMVLHACSGAGVVRHRLRDLADLGLRIEGYYAWS